MRLRESFPEIDPSDFHLRKGCPDWFTIFSRKLRIKESITLKEGRASLAAVRATVRNLSGTAHPATGFGGHCLNRDGDAEKNEGNLGSSFNSSEGKEMSNLRHMTCSDGDGCRPNVILLTHHHAASSIPQVLGPPSEHLLACRPSTCPGESKLRYLANTCQKLSLSTREPSKHEQLFENCVIEVATGQTEIFSKLYGVLGGRSLWRRQESVYATSRPVVSTELAPQGSTDVSQPPAAPPPRSGRCAPWAVRKPPLSTIGRTSEECCRPPNVEQTGSGIS